GPLLVLVVVLGRRGHVLVVVVARLPLVLVDLLVHVVLGVVDLGVLQVQLDVHDVAHRTLVVLGQVVGVGVVTAGELLGHGVVGREVVADQRVPVLVPVGVLLHRRRSEEHTSELQSRENLVCRLLLEKKNQSITG